MQPAKNITLILPWFIALILVGFIFVILIIIKSSPLKKEDSLLVRSVEVALPPPPPPPPPPRVQHRAATTEPSINLVGDSGGPALKFSAVPKLGLETLSRIEKPKFTFKALDLDRALSVHIPTLAVKNLDSIPRAVSHKRVKFPVLLLNRGIRRVDTQVELIIDQKGRAYVKKIVDPVYPEMEPVIRDWVAGVRFTVPTKNGKAVQAIYLYTIKFIYRV